MTDLVKVAYGSTGRSKSIDAWGMRPMQARVFESREARYLLVKAPPASGKSRALMFLGMDKLRNQGIRKVVVAVPERSIGSSFRSAALARDGFFADWTVEPRWNLCTAGAEAGSLARSKVGALKEFLNSSDECLVCTHATLRFAFDEVGVAAFDDCLVGIDEFHHVSSSEESRLGELIRCLIARGSAHIAAMTGSYFRGDSVAVLHPEDEARFTSVKYSYYEQLNGYDYLKSLGIGYHFYTGDYIEALSDVLDTDKKTIIHIPHVSAAEAYNHKDIQVGDIEGCIGTHIGTDPLTGFDLIRRHGDGRVLKVADLVNDKTEVRAQVVGSLQTVRDRDDVDIIIALGMAKEGFDWIWCEHALTIGYRSSLTEIVQIIGRATRDAVGKQHAQFTNLIAKPAAESAIVIDAVNDMLKAISGSLLMEQVLAPTFKFHSFREGQESERAWQDEDGTINVAIRGLAEASTERSRAIIANDMDDLVARACQNMSRRTIGDDVVPEVATQMVLREVVERSYENLAPDEAEEVRQHLAARMNVLALARREAQREFETASGRATTGERSQLQDGATGTELEHHGLLRLVRKFINVRDLDIDLIDSVNPYREAYDVASKALDAPLLLHIQSMMVAKRIQMTEPEARALWPSIKRFNEQEGRPPNPNATDLLERRLGEGLAYLRSRKAEHFRATGT